MTGIIIGSFSPMALLWFQIRIFGESLKVLAKTHNLLVSVVQRTSFLISENFRDGIRSKAKAKLKARFTGPARSVIAVIVTQP
jgi:hypothetical protein